MYCILPTGHIAHCTDPDVLYVLTAAELSAYQQPAADGGAIDSTVQITVEMLAGIGITPETIVSAYSLGFALVMLPAIYGWVVDCIKKLISHL